MGCDIHLFVEKLSEDGKWQSVDKWSDCEYEPGTKRVKYQDEFYSGRNYSLFAILADVRNGRGFAGVKTGEGFNPISEPRGVPGDLSEEVQAEFDHWDGDGHSHSYFTVAELIAYDWTQQTTHQGWVSLDQWARWKKSGKPESWSGGVGGGSVRHLDEAEVSRVAESTKINVYDVAFDRDGALGSLTEALGGGSVYTMVKWTEPYYASCSDFWSGTMPRLLALGEHDKVRVVFCFDN